MGKVLHASKSGWFPRCLTNSPGLPRDSNYIIGGLEGVMNVFWRVKKWQVSLNGSFSNPPSSVYSFDATHELSSAVEKEEDLVCLNSSNNFFNFFSSGLQDWGTNTYIPQQGDPPITEPVFMGAELYVGNGYLFPPYNTFESNAIVGNDGIFKLPFFWGIQTFSFLSDPLDQGWVPVGTYTLNVLGISASNQTLYGPDNYEFAEATATVSAKEYWSYSGTYDTTTGLPL